MSHAVRLRPPVIIMASFVLIGCGGQQASKPDPSPTSTPQRAVFTASAPPSPTPSATTPPTATPVTLGSLTLRLIEASGAPLAGATVSVYALPRPAQPRVPIEARTDAVGTAVFDNLPSDLYVVEAAHPTAARMAWLLPPLAAGATSEWTLRLGQGATLRGVVAEALGRASIAGAAVQCSPAARKFEHDRRPPFSALHHHATTDSSGRFTLEGLLPGMPYDIALEHAGNLQARLANVVAAASDEVTLLALPAATPAPTSALPAGGEIEETPGDIRGSVFDDRGQPVANAAVVLLSPPPQAGGLKRPPVVLDWTVTDQHGVFALATPQDSPPQLWTWADGYAPCYTAPRPSEVVTVRLARGCTAAGAVSWPDGTPAAGAMILMGDALEWSDAGGSFELRDLPHEFPLELEAWLFHHERWHVARPDRAVRFAQPGERIAELTLTLSPTYTIRGRVRDRETGTPIAGVRLSGERTLFDAISGADGRFELLAVPAGEFVLAHSDAPPPYVPRAGTLRLVVTDKDLDDVMIHLARGFVLSGTVADPSGQPAPQALVVESAMTDLAQGATTDRDGHFTLAVPNEAASRPLVLHAAHAQFSPGSSEALVLDASTPYGGIDIRLMDNTGVRGRVLDEDGAPIAAATIRFDATNAAPALYAFYGEAWRARPDADGHYQLCKLPPGAPTIHASRDNPGGERARRTVVLAAGQQLDGIDLVLPRAATPTPAGDAHIAGRVVDARERPVDSTTVRLAGLADPENTMTAVTGPDGRFRFDGLAPGTYLVTATENGTKRHKEVRAAAPSDDVVIVFEELGQISGRVIDARTDKPLAAFRVNLTPTTAMAATAQSKSYSGVADGRFVFPEVPPGEWRVAAEAPGYAHAYSPVVRLAAGQMVGDIVIALQPGATISGVVLNDRNEPVPKAAVAMIPSELEHLTAAGAPPAGAATVTDDRGAFTLAPIPTGLISLRATHPDYAPAQLDDVRADSAQPLTDIVIVLAAGGWIEGTVTRADGSPAPGRAVTARATTAGAVSQAAFVRTDANGYYRTETLAPGNYAVSLIDPDAHSTLPARTQFTEVAPGRASIVDFAAQGVRLYGFVLLGNRPLPNQSVVVAAAHPGGNSYAVASNSDGYYEIAGVTPGMYQVTVAGFHMLRGAYTLTVPPDVEAYSFDIVLPAASIAGVVTRAEDGAPVAGARVECGALATSSDRNGAFRLTGLQPGAYTVVASRQGYGRADAAVTVSEGEEKTGLVLTLSTQAVLRITLLDARNGQGIAGSLILTNDGGGIIAGANQFRPAAGRPGVYETDAAPGMYRLHAYSLRGYAGETRDVEVREGGATETSLALQPGVVLAVELQNDTGAAVMPEHVAVSDARGELDPVFVQVWSNTVLAVVVPGPCRVQATAPGHRPLDASLDVPPAAANGKHRVTLQLSRSQ